MPLTTGALTTRVFRVLDPLPQNFKEMFERNLQRHAFRPIDPERGELTQMGWVNIRQMLDSRLNLTKVMFRNMFLLSLRVDKLAINQKLFRAMLAVEIAKAIREKNKDGISKEEKLVIEDKVRMDLIKRTQPATATYEAAWHLESGMVFFGSTGERLCLSFSDLFTETFQVSLEPQFPFLRAQRWAEKQGLGQELLSLLPAPYSPEAPVDTFEVMASTDDE